MSDDTFRVQAKLFDDPVPKYLANGKFKTEEESIEFLREFVNTINKESK